MTHPTQKSKALATRITASLRAALEAEAMRSSRSLGQVASEWLEKGRLLAACERIVLSAAEGKAE